MGRTADHPLSTISVSDTHKHLLVVDWAVVIWSVTKRAKQQQTLCKRVIPGWFVIWLSLPLSFPLSHWLSPPNSGSEDSAKTTRKHPWTANVGSKSLLRVLISSCFHVSSRLISTPWPIGWIIVWKLWGRGRGCQMKGTITDVSCTFHNDETVRLASYCFVFLSPE